MATVTVWLAPGASSRLLGLILAKGMNGSISTCHGDDPVCPAVCGHIAENNACPLPSDGGRYVHVPEVADALWKRMRCKPALPGRSGLAASGS